MKKSILSILFTASVVISGGCQTSSVSAQNLNELLLANRTSDVEIYFNTVQTRFENSEINEFEVIREFNAFETLNEDSVENLKNWAASAPGSFVARTGLGIVYQQLGGEARGEDNILNTPPQNIRLMREYFQLAAEELNTSIGLTPKPYISIFYMLELTGKSGEHAFADQLLHQANEILPNNSTARVRRAWYMAPRWGGSYEEMDWLIALTKGQQAPFNVVLRLEALKYDDMGAALVNQGDFPQAMQYFERALWFGNAAATTFSENFLLNAQYYMCRTAGDIPICQ